MKAKQSGAAKVTFGTRRIGKHSKRQGPKDSPKKTYNRQG